MTKTFEDRVNFAANVIQSGRQTTRNFDNCFEESDGDAVCLALLRRIDKRPDTKLAQNIWRYLARDTVEPKREQYAGIDPRELSKKMILNSKVAR